jgi:uncharacterized protein
MRHPHGVFGWADLVTTDVVAARAFYTSLFGWVAEDVPTTSGLGYTMLRLDGKLVAGMGPQPTGMARANLISTWNSYVVVDDVDAAIHLVGSAGGTSVMGGTDVGTRGRMAMVADPGGAVLGLWQPRDHPGSEVSGVPGALVWNELQTTALERSLAFYERVFGWRWERDDESGYCIASLDTKPGDDPSVAGAMSMPEGVPEGAPNYWAVYVAVDDCASTLARAEALGGVVFLPAMEIGAMTIGGVTDPTGAQILVAAGAP